MNRNQFTFSYPSTHCIETSPFELSDEEHKYLLSIMTEAGKMAQNLLTIMLTLRGKNYFMDRKEFTNESVVAKQNVLFARLKKSKYLTELMEKYELSSFSFEYFQKIANNAYNFFVNYPQARGFEGLFFSPEKIKDLKKSKSYNVNKSAKVDGKTKKTVDEKASNEIKFVFDLLRKEGIFPILPSFGERNSGMSFGITQDVQSKLSSFDELQNAYNESRDENSSAVSEFMGKSKETNEYCALFIEIRDEIKKFNKDNYSLLISNWRDSKPNEETKAVKPGIRSILLELPSDYVFSEKDNAKCGYSYVILQKIFSHPNLWREKDIIGKQEYVKKLEKILSFTKESINISSFENGKLPRIHFGNNFTKFKLHKNDGRIYFIAKDIGFHGKTIEFEFCKSAHFCDNTEINYSQKKKGTESVFEISNKETGQYIITYSGDSKNRTRYTACINEPFLRYNVDKKRFYFDIPLTNHHMAHEILTDEIIKEHKERNGNILTYFTSAFRPELDSDNDEFAKTSNGKDISLKKNIFGTNEKIVFAGVDFGISNVFAISMHEANKSNLSVRQTKVINSSDFKNPNPEIKKRIDLIRDKQDLLRALFAFTNGHINGLDVKGKTLRGTQFKAFSLKKMYAEKFTSEVNKAYFDKDGNWVDKYIAFIDSQKRHKYYVSMVKLHGEEAGKNHLKKLLKFVDLHPEWDALSNKQKENFRVARKAKYGQWIIHSMLEELRDDISWMRSLYQNTQDKRYFCQNENYPGLITFMKKVVVQDYISLARRLYNYGENPSVDKEDHGAKGNERLCKDLYEYFEGLTQQCVRIADDMVNAVRFADPSVKIIFIEDMESRTSVYESSKSNKLKSLWAFGEIRKFLVNKAAKHNICVVPVNPEMTSQMYLDNGVTKLGCRREGKNGDARNLWIKVGGKVKSIDCDENAAYNIAMRGWKRCKDMTTFWAKEVGVDEIVITHALKKAKKSKESEELDEDEGTIGVQKSAGLYNCLKSHLSKGGLFNRTDYGNRHYIFKRDGNKFVYSGEKPLSSDLKIEDEVKFRKVVCQDGGFRFVDDIRSELKAEADIISPLK